MSILQQQLKESIRELETIQQRIEYSSQLAHRLSEEENELKVWEKKLIKEQRDVSALEKEGMTSLVRKIIGDREEKLENEQDDYLQASRRYTDLFKSIELMRFELDILDQKEDSLEILEKKIAVLLKEREKELILSDLIFAGLVKYFNEEVIKHHTFIKKLKKLKSTWDIALRLLTSIENHLNEALHHVINSKAGSAFLVDDALDYARRPLQKFEQILLRFQKELRIIFPEMHLDTKINFDIFEKYADAVFLANFTFIEKIINSRRSLRGIKEQVEIILSLLDNKYSESLDKLASIEEKRKKLFLDAS